VKPNPPADPNRRPRATRPAGLRRCGLPGAVALLGVLTAIASWPAAAVGLGPITQQSALGQSLRVVVPVIAAPGEELVAECFKLASAGRETDGIPQVTFGRVALERTPAGAQLVVTQSRPVNDPVLVLTIQTGCDTGVRREYTLFMDPPPIEAPLVAAESAARDQAAPAPQPAAVPPRRAGGAARSATARGGETGRAVRKAPPAKPRAAPKSPARRPPAPAATDKPRFSVSSAAPATRAAGAAKS
jgi:pilus assembly protein FimV